MKNNLNIERTFLIIISTTSLTSYYTTFPLPRFLLFSISSFFAHTLSHHLTSPSSPPRSFFPSLFTSVLCDSLAFPSISTSSILFFHSLLLIHLVLPLPFTNLFIIYNFLTSPYPKSFPCQGKKRTS